MLMLEKRYMVEKRYMLMLMLEKRYMVKCLTTIYLLQGELLFTLLTQHIILQGKPNRTVTIGFIDPHLWQSTILFNQHTQFIPTMEYIGYWFSNDHACL